MIFFRHNWYLYCGSKFMVIRQQQTSDDDSEMSQTKKLAHNAKKRYRQRKITTTNLVSRLLVHSMLRKMWELVWGSRRSWRWIRMETKGMQKVKLWKIRLNSGIIKYFKKRNKKNLINAKSSTLFSKNSTKKKVFIYLEFWLEKFQFQKFLLLVILTEHFFYIFSTKHQYILYLQARLYSIIEFSYRQLKTFTFLDSYQTCNRWVWRLVAIQHFVLDFQVLNDLIQD